MMNTSIKVADTLQAAAISELVNSAYRGEGAKAGWTTEASILEGTRTTPSAVCALIERAGNSILVKMDGEKILGCVHLEKKNETTAYLGMLSTNPMLQSKGVGSELILASEDYVRTQWGVSRIEMTVIDLRHELIAYYTRRGFKMTNEKRPFPESPENGRSLIGPLTFVVLEKDL